MANIEYGIWIMNNGGKPYMLNPYHSFGEVYNALTIMVSEVQGRHQPYYVDNDFFENEYPAMLNCRMFCIKEREVSEWEKYSQYKHIKLDYKTKNIKNNNVYKFPEIF